MPRKKRLRYGSYICLHAPSFEEMRVAMDEMEKQIEKTRDQIDEETLVTAVRKGSGPMSVYVSWFAMGKDWKEEQDDRQGGSAEM